MSYFKKSKIKNQRGIAEIAILGLVVVVGGAIGTYLLMNSHSKSLPQLTENTISEEGPATNIIPNPAVSPTTSLVPSPIASPTITLVPSPTASLTLSPTASPTTVVPTIVPRPTLSPTVTIVPPSPTICLKDYDAYKKVFSKSFDYGNGDGQFGISKRGGGLGPTSLTVVDGEVYIVDRVNNRIKVFDSALNQILTIPTEEGVVDIAVDKNGNIYAYTRMAQGVPGVDLLKYNSSGSLVEKVNNPPAFQNMMAGGGVPKNLYTVGNKLYVTGDVDGLKSYLLTTEEGYLLKAGEAIKVDGIYGYSGRRYIPRIINDKAGVVDVFDPAGNKINTVTVGSDKIETIAFLDEDYCGNIYIQIESLIDPSNVEVKINKYDWEGNLLITIPISSTKEDNYFFWTARDNAINRSTGDVWHIKTSKDKFIVEKWSVAY
ncbi:MAG TPA: hypothetical protein PLX73_01075 [Candidatus Paceibacterota bacterium]|nr:hypothetical protein [Candidatus Paceibacterota bacterium]HOL53939.1 hypothetical protein [Candidatus Paceibacterota bacterium]HPP16962.1 hypothetical protein [Candidatus Paceibacterota bacterium]